MLNSKFFNQVLTIILISFLSNVTMPWAQPGPQPQIRSNIEFDTQQGTWYVYAPTIHFLEAVHGTSENDVWMVGGFNRFGGRNCPTIHFDGAKFSSFTNPLGNHSINDIAITSNGNCWAVASDRILYWNGSSWMEADNSQAGYVKAIDIVSDNDIWGVGPTGSQATKHFTHYDGTSWRLVQTISDGGGGLRDIDMISTADGWAAGYGGIFHYDGTNWQKIFDQRTYGISCISSNDCWAASGDDVLHYDGQIWSKDATLLPEFLEWLTDIHMLSTNDGWAIGTDMNIFHYDGVNWLKVPSPLPRTYDDDTYTAIWMNSSNDGWIVGERGMILHWDGESWRSVGRTQQWMRSVGMVSHNDGWMVGDHGVILHYDGIFWASVPRPTESDLINIKMLSLTNGWAVGKEGTVIQYDGNNWSDINSPTSNDLFSLDMLSENDGWMAGENGKMFRYNGSLWYPVLSHTDYTIYAISIISSEDAWAVATSKPEDNPNTEILHFNGTDWSVHTTIEGKRFYSVDMTSKDEGWIVGEGGIIYNYNNGQWNEVASPTTANLWKVYMLDSLTGWAVGQDESNSRYGVVLKYNGVFWTVIKTMSEKYTSLTGFDAVTSGDSAYTWAAGEHSFILGHNEYWTPVEVKDYPFQENIPQGFKLLKNYPNPFNSNTVIQYGLPHSTRVTIKIYNSIGQEIETLVNQHQKAGYHTVNWDASQFSSGIYFYRMETEQFSQIRKMAFIR